MIIVMLVYSYLKIILCLLYNIMCAEVPWCIKILSYIEDQIMIFNDIINEFTDVCIEQHIH